MKYNPQLTWKTTLVLRKRNAEFFARLYDVIEENAAELGDVYACGALYAQLT